MYIVGSICEDGLGLTSWWTNADDDDDEVGDSDGVGDGSGEEEAAGAENEEEKGDATEDL
jgi:hypothetical protein